MIPEELRALPQWVAWRIEIRAGKPTKVPVNPHTGKRASSTDAATWGTYRDALGVVASEGIGFVFSESDPYCGIDMDDCIGHNGLLHEEAWRVVRKLDGYVEFSPSGEGLHIIVRARLERGRHTLKTGWGSEFAVYDRGRFFTMAGDGRGDVREAQAEVNELVAYYFPEAETQPVTRPSLARPASACGDDPQLLDRMLKDSRISALWAGDTGAHGDDHSAADLALCCHLAFFTGGDVDRMDSLFRRSGLMREKWDSKRGDSTYGRMTIDRAIKRGR